MHERKKKTLKTDLCWRQKKKTSCQMWEFFMVSGLKGEIDWYVQTFEATFSSKLFTPAVWNWLCIHDAKCRCDLYACCQCERITSRPNSRLDSKYIFFLPLPGSWCIIMCYNVKLISKLLKICVPVPLDPSFLKQVFWEERLSNLQ